MKISFIGPGVMPIPPTGWGGVEHLIWDMNLSLKKLGHEIQIINEADPNNIFRLLDEFKPDFVHIQYDEWVGLYHHIKYPCAITTHFAYIERPEMMATYKERFFDQFQYVKPTILGLSDGILNVYREQSKISDEKLFLMPNGIDMDLYQFTKEPKYPDRSICIGKIEERKKQYFLQQINSLWFAGNVADSRFDTSKNYLGELPKTQIFDELTHYGNLVLISDGEAHPRVCTEALVAGLGVVVSEWGTANLDLSKEFITVIPEDKVTDIEYIEKQVVKNREYSLQHRDEIREYAKNFEWEEVYNKFYFPSIDKIIQNYKVKNTPINIMDKNKSVHKLKGLPPIYYLNLDGQPDRAKYMEDQFKYWEIENYTRISAYDGREDDLSDIIKGRYPDNMSSGEVGCVTSHLKAIKHWMETSDSACALIMEDDCDISTAAHWGFSWKDFYSKVPYDYDVVQLAIINPAQVHLQMHRRFVNDFSTACYMITRHHAQKLINLHCRGEDKYKLDQGVKPRAVADDLIYNSGNTFAIPLFLYKIELGSSIHDIHVDVFHRSSHDGLWQFWRNQSSDVDDWNSVFDYDPYFGRIPPGWEGK